MDEVDVDEVAAREWELRDQQDRRNRAAKAARRGPNWMATDDHTWLYFGMFSLVVHGAIVRSFTEGFMVHVAIVLVGAIVSLVTASSSRGR